MAVGAISLILLGMLAVATLTALFPALGMLLFGMVIGSLGVLLVNGMKPPAPPTGYA